MDRIWKGGGDIPACHAGRRVPHYLKNRGLENPLSVKSCSGEAGYLCVLCDLCERHPLFPSQHLCALCVLCGFFLLTFAILGRGNGVIRMGPKYRINCGKGNMALMVGRDS